MKKSNMAYTRLYGQVSCNMAYRKLTPAGGQQPELVGSQNDSMTDLAPCHVLCRISVHREDQLADSTSMSKVTLHTRC